MRGVFTREDELRRDEQSKLDLDALLHPARAFESPSQVVEDPDLSLNEKRAILASWASDACAVEAAPPLRDVGGRVVDVDDILSALQALDRDSFSPTSEPPFFTGRHKRRWIRSLRPRRGRSGPNSMGGKQ